MEDFKYIGFLDFINYQKILVCPNRIIDCTFQYGCFYDSEYGMAIKDESSKLDNPLT